MNEERLSQLSAMFDGELPEAECELVARRLTRDDAQRAEWARYATLGAVIRRDPGVRIDLRIAERVRVAISGEGTHGEAANTVVAAPAKAATLRPSWRTAAGGFAIAAAVAGVSVLGLRSREVPVVASAVAPASDTVVIGPATASIEPQSYVVPAARGGTPFVPPAQLANYVVAHSEVSMPLSRRNLLSALVATEQAEPAPADPATLPEDVPADEAR